MTLYSRRIIFPEGDEQEAPVPLAIGTVVDQNGHPLALPLSSPKILAYRVFRIRTREAIGEEVACYFLERLGLAETLPLTDREF
ncbi:MAG: hypothetical protein LBQ61_08725 [Spirochaetales bacterium]|jgi:hypothetical protein|nr:hypothetical protein [Spirochaetales bacterium]